MKVADDWQVSGTCDPWFAPVREVFEDHLRRGVEHGAAVCLIVEGRLVVDLWAGMASRREKRPWGEHTLVNVYSATKAVAAFCVHHLVDQGRLALADPVARYWPEFAAAGKERITVAELLSHQAGLATIVDPIAAEARYDVRHMAGVLAAQAQEHPPGGGHAYHAQTYGLLVGELVRRVVGVSIGTYLRKEVAGPRGIDFWIGLPAVHDHRVAQITRPLGVEPPEGQPNLAAVFQTEPQSLTARAFNNPPPAPGAVNTRAFREAELAGSNGHGHARALAQIYGAAIGAWGSPLLSSATLQALCAPLVAGVDGVLRVPTRFAAGVMSHTRDHRPGQLGEGASDQAFGHPGMGGSLGAADPAAALAFGYTMNRAEASILVDPRAAALLDAGYRCL